MSKRLLWHSNAPFSSTGYGQQTGIFTQRLAKHYEVAVSSFYGLNGARLQYGDVKILPGVEGDWGSMTLPLHAESFLGSRRGGLIVSLMDVWVLDPGPMRSLNLACWAPVDHDPLPPKVAEFFAHSGAVPIAMSRFGFAQLRDFDPLYVPHGIDTTAYRPVPQAEARKFTDIPDGPFVVGMVAANKGNPSRKAFQEAFEAFKVFHDRHDDTVLYLHCELSGRIDGVNLPALMRATGVDQDSVLFTDQYRVQLNPIGPDVMAQVYSSLDVLLAASCGEGFGIPVVEAQACGVPAIVTDFSAQPEVCGAGWKVAHRPYFTPQNSWQVKPEVEDIVDALEKAYAAPTAHRKSLSEKAVAHAAQYDADLVLGKHMLPALKKAQERFAEREPETLKAAA